MQVRFSRSEPGYWLSAAVHAGLLALVLVHFSHEQKFDDAQEAIPVETITENQFSEIMKGERAKEATKPAPTRSPTSRDQADAERGKRDGQFSEIMKGEKTAKEATKPRADASPRSPSTSRPRRRPRPSATFPRRRRR